MKKIALLTSSRADYGIYFPLIQKILKEKNIKLDIIAFGTHAKHEYGYSADLILKDGFEIAHLIDTEIAGHDSKHVADCMSKTALQFSQLWSEETYDLIICLGDRYEMFAAVSASVPFNIPVAHIHGGETTLGAIDNKFRHCLSLFSDLHFVSTDIYQKKLESIIGTDKNVFNTGALSVDNLKHVKLFSKKEFFEKFSISLDIPSILITFHPETVYPERNAAYADILLESFSQLKEYQLIITMPNADTYGDIIREKFLHFVEKNDHTVAVETFGMAGYLTCMKYAKMMLGNTSSGFVEAAFFPKYVINLGERQRGRIITDNIFDTAIEKKAILDQVHRIEQLSEPESQNIYGNGDAASQMVLHIKDFLEIS